MNIIQKIYWNFYNPSPHLSVEKSELNSLKKQTSMKNSILLLIFCAFISSNIQGDSTEVENRHILVEDSQQSNGNAQIWFDPATNLLHLELSGSGVRDKISVQVGNSNGVIANEVFSIAGPIVGKFNIDLSDAPAGVYRVKVVSRTINAYEKFVIE